MKNIKMQVTWLAAAAITATMVLACTNAHARVYGTINEIISHCEEQWDIDCQVRFECQIDPASLACANALSAQRGEGCFVADPTLTPLNVRKSPNGSILGAINNGTLVAVMKRRGDWVRIVPHKAAGKSGWVWLKYLLCTTA
jgi:Bacterial SH3 domain